jgi:glycosyltransferase involved in cell wall biosynthesis
MIESTNYRYDISVIIPTYNRSKLLSYTLESLLLQNISRDRFEVIIADDGSTDDTGEMVKHYETQLNLKYLYQEDKGYRPASARNMGIRTAEGQLCVFIDSSVILNSNCLEEHLNFYARNGWNAAAIGYVYGFDNNKESEEFLKELVVITNPAESIKRLSQYPVYLDVRDVHYTKYEDKLENLPAPWYYFWTCHVSVPREHLLNIGLFDENFDGRWGSEDNELAFRLHQSGVRIGLLRAATSIHYPHGKDKGERQKEGQLNCAYFHEKFPTVETRVFFTTYMKNEFVDINDLIIMELEMNEK